MREYESVTVLRPTMTEEEVEAEITATTALIAANGGEMIDIERWGRRRLAYEIEKLHEGIYTLYHFNGTPQTVHELDRRYRLSERMLRHLTVLSEGPLPQPEEEVREGEGGDRRHGDGDGYRGRRDRVIED
ncbi:MAG: 30S ribosomal protein S6 [Candidatus Eisenbacteria bacterium]|nr:30S ribosomal protein S6 [Candidatus Eisenbacteria bacterium]MCC7143264.1 30S ribosomal protein S6 [Candidatus Eisenbacteria bacterium]